MNVFGQIRKLVRIRRAGLCIPVSTNGQMPAQNRRCGQTVRLAGPSPVQVRELTSGGAHTRRPEGCRGIFKEAL
jgi:hypothetical protein